MLLVPEKIEGYRRQLRLALEENRIADAVRVSAELSAHRVANHLMEAPDEAVIPFLLELSPRRAGRVIGAMKPDYAAELVDRMENGQAAKFFPHIPVHQAADILQRLSEEDTDSLLSQLSGKFKHQLETLHSYPEDSAGSVMSADFISIHQDNKAGQTLDALYAAPDKRRQGYIYVTDRDGKLQGVVALSDLVAAPKEDPLSKFMITEVLAFRTGDPALEAAKALRYRRLMQLPVVDDKGVLAGVVSFDDAMRILSENVAEKLAGLGGGTSEESFFTPPLRAVKGRLPWMAANVFLNLGAVAVISGFEDTIAQVAILAAFLPMITDMGGNVGIQALSVSIRSLALGEVRLRDVWRAVRKELTIGVINGIALGALFAVVATVLQGNPLIGILAGIALAANVLLAGLVGGCLPFLIKRIGKDPAMMTGPVLTTITDITGVSIYLGLSTVFLSGILS